MIRKHFLWLSLLAVAVTLLNALKPLHMDDGAFYGNALQSAYRPGDPYGFTAFWSQWPEPANWAVCPPVFPYWWGAAIRLFGNSPFLWKLSLLPFVALFVFSMHDLFRRFAAGMELPLTFLTALSPTFLPSLNMMLDIPATGLGLGALCLGIRSVQRKSAVLAAVAGLIAGIAMETKYTAATIPALIFIYAILHRKFWSAVLPGAIALGFFVMCEALIARRYGSSHFLYHLGLNDPIKGAESRGFLWAALPRLVGGLAPALAILGLAALNVPAILLVVAGVGVVAEYAVLTQGTHAEKVFLIAGIFIFAVTIFVATRLKPRKDCDDAFIVAWLLMEVLAFAAISPFAAARRAMGVVLILTLVFGRLASQRNLMERRFKTVFAIVALGVVSGFGFYFLDLTDAFAQKNALYQAARVVDSARQSDQKVWFTGHWGFQFYAIHAGFEPVVPDHSLLHRGDWLIYPHAGINPQRVAIPLALVDERADIQIDDRVSLASVPFFYGGEVPVDHRALPRVWLSVYQVKSDFVPPTSYSADFLADWAVRRHRPLPPASITAVLRAIGQIDPRSAAPVWNAIADSGPPGLVAALVEGNSTTKAWAADHLAALGPAAKDALPALRDAEQDSNASVREAATAALQQINNNK